MSIAIYNSFQNNVFGRSVTPSRTTFGSSIAPLFSGTSDQFIRSSPSTVFNNYSASKYSANRSAPDIISIEARQQAAKDYDAILSDLRKKYAEPEAMRRFDEIMRADGFERLEYSNANIPMSLSSNDSLTGLVERPTGISHADQAGLISQLHPDTDSKNMVLHSMMASAVRGDEAVVSAESWAVYGASRPYSDEVRDYWQNRYKDSAQSQADFDVDSYMAALPDASQRSIVSANAGMGSMVSSILAENGITLGEEEYLEFKLDADGEMLVGGNYTVNERDLTEIFKSAEGFLDAFNSQMSNPPLEDVSGLDGAFRDGDRSAQYSATRSIVFSTDEPSAAVVNDRLGVIGKGYTYVKKAGDYFDPNAGSYSVAAQPSLYDHFTKGQDAFAANIDKCRNAANNALAEAVRTGQPVQGNASREEIDQIRAQSFADWQNYNENLTLYDESGKIVSGGDPQTETMENTRPESKILSESPSYIEEEQVNSEEERMASLQKIIAQIQSKYFAIDTLIRP